jgi:hypothetical protein
MGCRVGGALGGGEGEGAQDEFRLVWSFAIDHKCKHVLSSIPGDLSSNMMTLLRGFEASADSPI